MGPPVPHTRPAFGWALLLAGLFLIAAAPSASADQALRGACRFEVPRQHAGVLDELGPACGPAFEAMLAQLGAPPLLRPIPVRVVVRNEELAGAAPAGVKIPTWAAAYAVPHLPMVVVSLRDARGASNVDLPVSLAHELSHVAMHHALSGVPVPRWFSEGVAIQQSETFPIERFLVLLDALRYGRLVPLSRLERYPVHAGHVNLAYAEAADFVGFLLRREGWFGVRVVVRRLAQGDSFEDAFATAFHGSVSQLEKLWVRGLPTAGTWIQMLTSSGLLWGLVSILLCVAYASARRRHKLAMARLAAEDELSDYLLLREHEEAGDRRTYH